MNPLSDGANLGVTQEVMSQGAADVRCQAQQLLNL